MPEKYVPKYRAPKRGGFGRFGDKTSSGGSGNEDFKLPRRKEPVEMPPAHNSHVRPAEAPPKPAAAAEPEAPVPSRSQTDRPNPPRSHTGDLFPPETASEPPARRATGDQFDLLVAGRISEPAPVPVKASPSPAESLRPPVSSSNTDDGARQAARKESGSTLVDAFEGTKVKSAIQGGGEAWDPFLKDPEPSHKRFSRNGGMSDMEKLTTSKTKPKKAKKKPQKVDRRATSHERQQHQTLGQWLKEILILGLVAILTAVLLTNYVVQAFFIPSESMEATLAVDDRVLVNKLVYNLREPQPGDIIVFTSPERNTAAEAETGPIGDVLNEAAQGLGLRSSVQDLIKRVVAVEGQTIEVKIGSVFVDGEQIDEPYRKDFLPMPDFPPTEVPAGHVFVMGDNRFQSHDSRDFGPVAEDTIVGRAFALIWPVTRFTWLSSSTG
ncbi:MAG: signal peptidase I [Actinomycetota bacterium]